MSERSAETVIERDVAIPMRDGVVLRADVYRPPESDNRPALTVLVRTTYDKSDPEPDMRPTAFVDRGYAVVLQDIRGRYASDGEFYHGIYEVDDGYDTLEWIAAQPWSNGLVGMTGISYLAAVQCAAACSGSPHLASIFHVFAPSDYYDCGHRQGGSAALYMIPITFMFAASTPEIRQDPTLSDRLTSAFRDSQAWLGRLPLEPGGSPLAAAPTIEQWLLDILGQPDYGEFWTRVELWEPHEHVDRYADVPGCYVGGWYDMYHEETFFELLAPAKRGPIRLVIGPWTHLSFHLGADGTAGDVDFGPEARFGLEDFFALQLDWFDATLAAPTAPGEPQPPVRLFVMGGGDGRRTAQGKLRHGGHWRDEHEWPPARAKERSYYLGAGGRLSTTAPASDVQPTTYTFDPRDPAPTVGGVHYFLRNTDPWDLFVPYGPQDQRELGERHDVQVFQTEPLAADVEVTGVPIVELWVSSSARDTDFTARLVDVYPPNEDYPDGYALNLADGVLRMRYRDSRRKATLMEPGEVYRAEIRLYATSNVFQRGHRIRIDVSSSSFPAYDVNDNTGGTLMTASVPLVARNSVHHDARYHSRVRLPIIEEGHA
jgi:putative CocE/NonD family hydrolase